MHPLLMLLLCAFVLSTLAACEPIRTVNADDPAGSASVEATSRCLHCGWIEAKRELAPQPGEPDLPVFYEYTVRMTDGSASRFRDKRTIHWRIGERLMIIAGETDSGRDRPAR